MTVWNLVILAIISSILVCCEPLSYAICRGYFRAKREHLKELVKMGEPTNKFE
jgi:hypothetical protein